MQLVYRGSGLARWRSSQPKEAGHSFLRHEQGLAIAAEQHVIGFPVSFLFALIDKSRTFIDGDAVFDMMDRAAATFAQPATAMFFLRQKPVPVILLATAMVDKAVYGFMADDRATVLTRQPSGDLLRRPLLGQASANGFIELGSSILRDRGRSRRRRSACRWAWAA